MKKPFFVSALFLCILFSLSFNSFAADNWTVKVNLLIGRKNLIRYRDFMSESHSKQGVIFDFAKQSSPIALTMGLTRSKGEILVRDEFYWHDVMDFEMDVTTKNLGLGIKYIMRKEKKFRPYLSFDMTWNASDGKATHPRSGVVVKDSYKDIDAQIGTGFYSAITNHLYWGLDLNLSVERIILFNIELDHGATNVAILFGYQFGSK